MVRVLTASQYVDLPRPALTWLIPSYIPYPGLVLLAGAPKAGKSYLGLQVALYVASGKPFLGQPVSSASVLYLQLDTSETIWRQRLRDLHRDGVEIPDTLHFVHPDDQLTRVNILEAEGFTHIRDAITACNPKLIVLDVLRECHDADEQDSTGMKQVGDALMTLAKGRSLLVIHHMSKVRADDGPPDPVSAARGSSYITGKADAIWMLYGGNLTIKSRFHLDEKKPLRRLPSGLWQF